MLVQVWSIVRGGREEGGGRKGEEGRVDRGGKREGGQRVKKGGRRVERRKEGYLTCSLWTTISCICFHGYSANLTG